MRIKLAFAVLRIKSDILGILLVLATFKPTIASLSMSRSRG
jgi:hypothetical protein